MNKIVRKLLLAVLTAAVIIGTVPHMAMEASAASTQGLGTTTHSQAEIRQFYLQHPINEADFTFKTQPSVTAPYALGEVSNESRQNALNLLNMYRYIAGVKTVSITSDGQKYAQGGALVSAINHKIVHGATGPSDMSSELKQICAYGSFNSNLAGGGSTLTGMVRRFMLEINGDPDFGHRRQLLKPELSETGFGAAVSDTGGTYMATFVNANMNERTVVAYPGENQPLEFFGTGYAWTVTIPGSITASSVLVTVTNTATGKVWKCSTANNNLRADPDSSTSCIIFQPDEITYREGDRYKVEVTGIPTPITYYVNMFYVADKIPVESVTTNYAGVTTYADPEGTGTGNWSPATITAIVEPENASNQNVEWVSSDPSIAIPVWYGSSSCKVRGLKPGTVTFTAITEDGGFTKDVKVEVRPKGQSIDVADEVTIGVGQSLTLTTKALPEESRDSVYYNYSFDNTVISISSGSYSSQKIVKGLKKGTTDIVWYCGSNHNATKTTRVNVVQPVYISKIKLNREQIELKKGETFQLEATYEPTNATLKGVTWKSSNTNVAKVDSNGLVSLAYSYGTATITATATDGSGVTAACEVTRHKHDLVKTDAVPATCEETGVRAYWTCSTCKEMFSDSNGNYSITEPQIAPALGHYYDSYYTIDKPASCSEEGLKSIHCIRSGCGAVKPDSEVVIPKKAHSYGSWTVTKRATCIETGTREKKCYYCTDKVVETIPLTDHSWNSSYTVDVPATCESEGSESIHCSVCGAVKPGTERSIAKAPHNYGSWTVDKENSCTEDGSRWRVCSDCGYKDTEVLGAKGHKWNNYYTQDIVPTCTTEGQNSIHCNTCGAIKPGSVRTIAKMAHYYGDWTVIREATTEQTGLKERTCRKCGYVDQKVIAKLEPAPSGSQNSGSQSSGNQYNDDDEWLDDDYFYYDDFFYEPADISYEVSPAHPASAELVESRITSIKSDSDQSGSAFGLLQAKGTPKSKSSVRVTWKPVPRAAKYVIYGNRCGVNNRCVKLTETTGTSFTFGKLAKGTYYKYVVVAVRGDKAVSISKTIHVATKGGKVGNYKKVTVKSSVTKKAKKLKVGKTLKISAKQVKSGKVKKHRGIAYESSNPAVATVTGKGKVKGINRGTCFIYAYAQNGVSKKIKVTVK